ncbi:DoxX family protein [Streptomyces tremellae]|uniref:DoxX family protein n=1 Tax=Streptomyces tremellae TaxID=1124239 RepID=A0ABP7G693_9ACTN
MTIQQVFARQRGSEAVGGGPVATASTAQDTGLLLLRVVFGLIMAAHGAQKLFGWFGGGGVDGTAQFFKASGYPAAKFLAVVAGLIETGGGVAIVLGLLTPLAAAALLGDMVNAAGIKWGGFFAPQGLEYELLLACLAGVVALTGPGRFAVDRSLPVLREHRIGYGGIAVLLGLVAAAVFLIIRR